MPIEVELPDKSVAEFPDDMPQDKIQAAIQNHLNPPDKEGYTPRQREAQAMAEKRYPRALMMTGEGEMIPEKQPGIIPATLRNIVTQAAPGTTLEEAVNKPIPQLLPQGVQEAIKTGAKALAINPLVNLLPAKAKAAVTGAYEGAGDVAESLTSPLGIATLVAKAPQGLQRLIAGAFAAQSGKEAATDMQPLTDAIQAGDWETASRLAIGKLGGMGVAALAGTHAVGPEARPVPPNLPPEIKAAERVLPRAAQAAKENILQEQTEETEPGQPDYHYASPESKAWWEKADELWENLKRIQADESTFGTPERKAARQAVKEHDDLAYGEGGNKNLARRRVDLNQPLAKVNAVLSQYSPSLGQANLTGWRFNGDWTLSEDGRLFRKVTSPDGKENLIVWRETLHPVEEAALNKNTEGGEENAGENEKTAAVHGDVREQPGTGEVEVPAEEGGAGVQPSAEQKPAQAKVALSAEEKLNPGGSLESLTPELQALHKKVAGPAGFAAKQTGWTFDGVDEAPGMSTKGMTPEQKAELKPMLAFTDRRPGSPTEGTTTYVPADAKFGDIVKQLQDKAAEVTAAKAKEAAKPAEPIVDQPAKKTGGKGFTQWAYHPSGQHDLLDEIHDLGGVATPSQMKFKNGGEYDAYQSAFGTGMAQRLRRSEGGRPPDLLLDDLRNKGTHFENVDKMYEAVERAARERQGKEGRARAEAREIQKGMEQNEDFIGTVVKGEGTFNPPEKASVLKTGSKFKVNDQEFTVTGYDREADIYELEDGTRWGRQHLHAEETFHPDPGSLTTENAESAKGATPKLGAGEKKTGDLFKGEDQPFNLAGEKGTDAERIAAENEKAERDKQEAAEIAGKQQQTMPLGPGAATAPGAVARTDIGAMESNIPPLEKLTQTFRNMPVQPRNLAEAAREWADSIGTPIKNKAQQAWTMIRATPAWIKAKATTLPSESSLTRRVGEWDKQAWISGEAQRVFSQEVRRVFKDRSKLRALSNWINAGGDRDLLTRWAAMTKDPALKKTYADALKFGPAEENLAAAIRHYHDEMLAWAQREGALDEGLDNYLHRYYRKDDPTLQKKLDALNYLRFNQDFAGFKKRYYDSDFEAEQAGLKPEKDAAKRIAAYDYGFSQALIAREFVKNSFDTKKAVLPDGRPELDVMGGSRKVLPKNPNEIGLEVDPVSGEIKPAAEKGKGATLISPKWKPMSKDAKDYRGDYVAFEHPAFKKWKFVGADDNGKPILLEGDIKVHPAVADKYKALFEKSWWSKGPARRAAMQLSTGIKQIMLKGPFHLVQITTGGVEHRINPFKLLDINTSDPAQQRMAKMGLFGEQGPYSTEGVGGGDLLEKVPIAGQFMQTAKNWLFQDYIPRWKMTLALATEARDMQKFSKELARGEVTPEQISRNAARQTAAVFGGGSQRAIFRSKTFQDNLRMLFLAPDFGEERIRQSVQAFGSKYGHQQRMALVAGGMGLMVLAKTIEYGLTGQINWKKPFSVTYNNKEYSLRNPAADLWHLGSDPIGYLRNRLNPGVTRPMLEMITGRDAFGRKRTAGQQLSDEVKQVVPIPMRGLVEGQSQNLVESMLNSTGITEHRASAFGQAMKDVNTWKEKKGYTEPGEFVYDADKDPYSKLTTALTYGSMAEARKQLDALTAGKTPAQARKIAEHYRRSLAEHPYLTGSRAHEQEYVKGLSGAAKERYDEAKAERKAMWQKFVKAWRAKYPAQNRN